MSPELRLLLIEDSEDDAALILRVLKQAGYSVQWRRVDTADGLREALSCQTWDVLLSDYRMPQLDAPEALAILQASGLDIPFIVVSGTIGEEAAVEMMKAGAHDYLMKGRLVRLPPVVTREREEANTRKARRQAEERLRIASMAVENSPVSVLITDARGTIQYVNPHFREITGYTSEDVIGQNPRILKSGEMPAGVFEDLWETISSGKVWEGNLRNRKKNGDLFWEHAKIAPIHDLKGQVSGYVAVQEDITEHVLAERALQGSEMRYQLISENMRDLICLHDLDGTYTYVSPSVKDMLGYEPEELIGTSPYRLFHLRDMEEIQKYNLTHERPDVAIQYRIRKKDGSYLWVETITQPILGAHGDVVKLQTATHDVSDHVSQQEALHRQNEVFQLAQRATNDAIWDWDILTGHMERGAAIRTLFGFQDEPPLPRIHWWFDHIHPEDRERVRGGFDAVLDGGGTVWSDEYRFRRGDGSYARVLDRGYVVRDSDGSAQRMVGAMVDLSDRILAEEAQAANKAKSEFLATMTHELRTPMIGMLGMVEILSHTSLDADQRRSLETIQSSARSLLDIIGNVLDFSKIESGRLELDPQAVSLEALCEEKCAQYSGAASGMGLNLCCEIDPRLAKAHHADPTRLGEILGNFISNALKFTPRGSAGLRVEVLESDGERQNLAFRVWDTGIGVSKENQRGLFQPFVQAESDTTRRFGGTGLGLSISLRLAEMMGGEITMESAERQGTTMSLIVSFPLADPAALTVGSAVPWKPVRPPDRDAAEAAGSLILLAEDHPTNRIVLLKQIQLTGYQADVAKDGESALVAWTRTRYGLVLTDVQMPSMDGYQLAEKIRDAERAAGEGVRVPILALTANALQGELERCRAAGMDDCIIKPVGIPALSAKLQQWLPFKATDKVDARSEPEELAIPAPDSPAFSVDLKVLGTITGGNLAAALDLLQDFSQSMHQDLAELRTAMEKGDLRASIRHAHRIKGASLLIGAGALAEAANTLERTAGSSSPEELAARIVELETAFAAVETFTDEQYGKSTPAPA